jgi:hypothetical protein
VSVGIFVAADQPIIEEKSDVFPAGYSWFGSLFLLLRAEKLFVVEPTSKLYQPSRWTRRNPCHSSNAGDVCMTDSAFAVEMASASLLTSVS